MIGRAILVGLLGLAALCPAASVVAQARTAASAGQLDAFIGRWQIDPERTRMGRNGPGGDNLLRNRTFTFVFVRDVRGVRMDVYAQYPQSSPTRTAMVILDRKVQPCAGPAPCLSVGGTPAEQTFAWYPIDERLIARQFWVKGTPYDASTLAVSSDGQTLTLISWDPKTPQWQNIQVFTRQSGS